MLNPLDSLILDRFLCRNWAHFESHRSLVACSNDVHRDLLRERGVDTVFRDSARRILLFTLP